jgi:succinate dehydrogenase/fumarate reductase flavoprotein subunit
LNQRAIDLYRDHGIDLVAERLEIGCCAQHNNGGLRANHWWESNIKHLFPVGEVNGTHGVVRPGGAALNAGQVGALRAAVYVAAKYRSAPPDIATFVARIHPQIGGILDRIALWLSAPAQAGQAVSCEHAGEIRQRMTRSGAQIRSVTEIRGAIEDAWHSLRLVDANFRIGHRRDLPAGFKTLELALSHVLYLEAIGEHIARGGKSRGSYLVLDPQGDQTCGGIGGWRFSLTGKEAFVNHHILELAFGSDCQIHKQWRPVRPIPAVDDWFENVWKEHLERKFFEEIESQP